ncbi:MAG: ankyrin repeat domain-containing protein [Gammaproteobacteria bacterium]
MYIVPISFGLLMQRDCDPKILSYLLNNGLNANAVEPATGSGPLETALSFSNTACAKVLITHGADVNATTRDGASPLLRAVGYENMEMAKLLLTMHANPNVAMDNGVTPLILAATIRASNIALLLLKYGANPCAQNHQGMTASDVARDSNINGPGNQELAALLMCKSQATNESGGARSAEARNL